jgi:hypothetical protein
VVGRASLTDWGVIAIVWVPVASLWVSPEPQLPQKVAF